MIDFTEKFTTYSNADLLKIVERPSLYQPLAVETAQAILATRQVSGQDFEIARKELAALEQEKEAKAQKKQALERKIKNIVPSILSAANPMQTNTAKVSNPDRIIKVISIIFGGLFLLRLYGNWGTMRFIFVNDQAGFDLTTVLFFSNIFIIPVATVLFFKRKRLGWTLLSIFLTYSAVDAVVRIIWMLAWRPPASAFMDYYIAPQYSPVAYIWALLLFAGALWMICKARIREAYTIDKRSMFKTIGTAAALTVLIIGREFIG